MVVIERHASFTGLDNGDVDLTAPIPNTSMSGVWRIETNNRYSLVGLVDDPSVYAGVERGWLN